METSPTNLSTIADMALALAAEADNDKERNMTDRLFGTIEVNGETIAVEVTEYHGKQVGGNNGGKRMAEVRALDCKPFCYPASPGARANGAEPYNWHDRMTLYLEDYNWRAGYAESDALPTMARAAFRQQEQAAFDGGAA